MRTQKQTAAGRWLGLIVLALLVGLPLVEIALFIEIGGRIGLGATLALIVLSAVLGVWILRRQGLSVLTRAQRQLAAGALPVLEVFEGLCLAVAGALLLTPGFFTDALGALLLVPAVRRALYRQVGRRIEPHIVRGREDLGAGPWQDQAGGPMIDAEYEEITPDPPRPPGNGQTMPPPRGDWGRRP